MRKPALPPQTYNHEGIEMIYPKDADAGGTWISLKDNGDAAVLLNGGFKKHTPHPPYRLSRGLVFIDIVKQERPVQFFKNLVLDDIEPFTLLLFIEQVLTECRWDGQDKHITYLRSNIPHIWSSATLYDEAVIKKREQWFEHWLMNNPAPAVNDIFNFHRFGGDGDMRNDINMNRDGIYHTVSITVMQLTEGCSKMHYLDLKNNQSFTKHIETCGQAAV